MPQINITLNIFNHTSPFLNNNNLLTFTKQTNNTIIATLHNQTNIFNKHSNNIYFNTNIQTIINLNNNTISHYPPKYKQQFNNHLNSL